MKHGIRIDFGNLLLSLSEALDITSPELQHHQLRTAYISWELGKVMGLNENLIENNFVAALLHDIGAMTVEEKLRIHELKETDTEPHCIRGEILLNRVEMLKHCAPIIKNHHRQWLDWKDPIEDPRVQMSQVLMLADHLERMIKKDAFILHQNKEITAGITSMAGKSFHPRIVDAFITTASREEFWLDLVSTRLYSILLNNGPQSKLTLDLDGIITISEFLRDLVDFKSRFTITHTTGVTACSLILARLFGFSLIDLQHIEVAANLHDLGRLTVPNKIFEKPGKLSDAELAVMKSHTHFTYAILNSIEGLGQITEWAAFHHEKLDGSGYPFHCKADELGTGARIIAIADIFTALTEERPYRKGMPKDEVLEILNFFTKQQLLDDHIITLLKNNYEEVHTHVMNRQAGAKKYYANNLAFLDVRVI